MLPDAYVKTILTIWSERGDKTSHSIQGNCMSPVIREGDCIFIKHGSQDIRTGDVVVAEIAGSYRVQRVIRKEARNGTDTFLLKGDQSSFFYESIVRDAIVGKVVEISGSNGHLNIDSPFWKGVNYILSIRSFISVRSAQADSLFWKGVNALFTLRAAVFSGKQSLSLIPVRSICSLSRRWFQMRKRHFDKS